MGLNDTPTSERIHIGFFGRRNAGKSSLVNAVTNQQVSVVSSVRGTTTDPVTKTMELLPLGPVMIIDTPGFDDEGELGELRVNRTREILRRVDIAILVIDANAGKRNEDKEIINIFKSLKIPYIIAYNKCDLTETAVYSDGLMVSARNSINIDELKNRIAKLIKPNFSQKTICRDLVRQGDLVVLVMPIDSSAPKGRLILPQQQTIRDILDVNACALCLQESELKQFISNTYKPPSLVITDSQIFKRVSEIVPERIPLTSFSILMARYKGFLKTAVRGAIQLDRLRDGDKILISEGCTHDRKCGDIGSVKLPSWINEYTGKNLDFSYTSGLGFEENLSDYSLIIHCGGCMLNEKEMQSRMNRAEENGIPFTNYGTATAHINGILKRSLKVLPEFNQFNLSDNN